MNEFVKNVHTYLNLESEIDIFIITGIVKISGICSVLYNICSTKDNVPIQYNNNDNTNIEIMIGYGFLEVSGGGVQSKITADDWPLIQPSEVQVAVPPVLTAESRLTPIGTVLH